MASQDTVGTYSKADEDSVKQFLLNEIIIPNIQPTPLKNYDANLKEAKLRLNEYFEQVKRDINKGLVLFLQHAKKKEHPLLRDIWKKVACYLHSTGQESEAISEEDCLFLETLAKRQLVEEQKEDAACMFRLIIQINPFFGRGWVGWAISEQNTPQLADWIYEIGLSILPTDYILRSFAAKYYLATKQVDKAINVLEGTLELLSQIGEEKSHAYQEVSSLLNNIGRG